MEHSLRVTVDADVLPGPVQVIVHGCLTESSFPALLKVLDRGVHMEGCPEFRLDLLELEHMDQSGLHAVERYVHQHNQTGRLPVMNLRAPNDPRHCGRPESDDMGHASSAEDALQPAEISEVAEVEPRQVKA